MTIEHRTNELELEIRGDDGRTLIGTAVPYGVDAQIGSYTERFTRGAFAGVDPAAVPLLAVHDHHSLPLGRAMSLTETDAGLEAELRVSATRAGDEVLELVKDGALSALSIGFRPVEDRWNAQRTHVERRRAELVEISLVTFPSYETARIAAVRGAPALPPRTPRLTVARWD